MAKALIVSAGNNANEYLARHIGELGYTRPTIVASGGEARRRMDTNDFEVVIINTPLPDEFGHELGTDAVEKTDAGVILLAKTGTAEQIADKLQDFGVLVLASRSPAHSSGRPCRSRPAATSAWPCCGPRTQSCWTKLPSCGWWTAQSAI